MSYRLYTKDVEEGLVDFNDQEYHLLKTVGDYSLVFNDCSDQFIVAYKVQHHNLDSIDWAQGHYFNDVLVATEFFKQKVTDLQKILDCDELSEHTIKVIVDNALEARADGNIPNCSLGALIDLSVAFIRDNPDLFDSSIVDELDSILE